MRVGERERERERERGKSRGKEGWVPGIGRGLEVRRQSQRRLSLAGHCSMAAEALRSGNMARLPLCGPVIMTSVQRSDALLLQTPGRPSPAALPQPLASLSSHPAPLLPQQ
jgi:hypothetical protein